MKKIPIASITGILLAWSAAGLLACAPSLDQADGPQMPEAITRKIVLMDAGPSAEAACKALIEEAGLTRAQAEALIADLPGVVATGLSHGEADRLSRALMAAGMTSRVHKE